MKKTKKKSKKESKKNKLLSKNMIIALFILGGLAILAGILMLVQNQDNKDKSDNQNSNLFPPSADELTPLQVSQSKEVLQGKTMVVKGAYIPSEAFIYVKENQDRIYLKPANRNYCRNYDLVGILDYNKVLSRWEFYPENYDNCLDN